MGTTSIHVTLPQALKDHIEKRVAEGEFTSPSDYVRELIRSDQKLQAREQLDRLLLEGLDSPVEEVSPEYLEELRRAQTPASLFALQTQAKKSGANRLSPEDIEKEIHAVRQESVKRDRR